MDETGWRLKGARRTLWGAFTDTLAVYRIGADRHEDCARELLGFSSAIVTSDRWWAYNHLPLARRQICWSHLQRDFQALAEGGGAEKELATSACGSATSCSSPGRSTSTPASARNSNARSDGSSASSSRSCAPTKARSRATSAPADWRATSSKVWAALWTFARRRGVQPTNNHAERALRGAVIYRKLSLGSQSEDGERRIERLLSASSATGRSNPRRSFASGRLNDRLNAYRIFDRLMEPCAEHTSGRSRR